MTQSCIFRSHPMVLDCNVKVILVFTAVTVNDGSWKRWIKAQGRNQDI